MGRGTRSKLAFGERQIHQPCPVCRYCRLATSSLYEPGVGRLGRDGCSLLLLLGGQVLFDPVFLLLKMVQAGSERVASQEPARSQSRQPG